MNDKTRIRPCLWFNKDAEEAAEFYAATFPDTRIDLIQRAPGDYPSGTEGSVLVVELTLMGTPVMFLNGGPLFSQSEAFSFQVFTEDQEETDRYWSALVGNGGQESQCSWCKDRWGVSWQIVPRALLEGMKDPDPAAAKRVFQAMMGMQKIDIAAIEAARRGS